VCVASVFSPRSGFVAVVSVNGEPSLVASLAGKLSTDLESQIAACQLGNGVDVQTTSDEDEVALRQLREWSDRECASALAGLADSSTLRRKRLLNRIDTAIENAPPHLRNRRLMTAAKARRVAAAQHSAAIEAELESLAAAPLSDDDWLSAIANLETARATSGKAPKHKRRLGIHAVLILQTADLAV
jgi:hypothetical protein